jgi:hypothetical protein
MALNANQQTFAGELAAKTGLAPNVVAGWVMSEEPASSKQAPNGANNWLNIGSTDSGFYGAGNPAWSNPTAAADFTAQWMNGATAPGYGTASAGIRNILSTAGQNITSQITAIQHSGWASSGYPNLVDTVSSVTPAETAGLTTDIQKLLAQGPGGLLSGTPSIGGAASGSADLGGAAASAAGLGGVATFFENLTKAQTWVRVGEVIAGIVLIVMGLMSLSGRTTTPVTVVRGAARTGKKAAMAAAA